MITTRLCLLLCMMPVQICAASNEYPMTDICRATLNVMLKRDISIMVATKIDDGSARVKYTRPQDGKAFSYRCRSIDGHTIGILDETLVEPRWYGERSTDIQRSYKVKDDVLFIRTIYGGDLSEDIFSHNQLSVDNR